MATLREAERGEKTELIRQLLAEHPTSGNTELAAIFLDRIRAKGIKEDRELKQVAQAFANEKATAKKRAEGATGVGNGMAPVSKSRPAPSASGGSAGFTVADLEALQAMATRMGGYAQLLELVQWLASRAA